MNSNIAIFEWRLIGSAVLFVSAIILLILFGWNPSYCKKTLIIGLGIFSVSIVINIIGISEISDFLSALGFIVITIALLRLFWDDTNNP